MSEDSSEELLNEPTKFEIQCKVCNYKFVSILKHLGQQIVCMEKYDAAEIQELKKTSLQNTLRKRKAWKDGNKNHISAYNSIKYQENKTKVAEKNQQRYLKRKAEKAELRKKKYIENEKKALEWDKSNSPKESRRHNQFQKDWLVNHRKFLFEKLREVNQSDKIQQFEKDIEDAFDTNEKSISQVEEEVNDKGIDESQIVRSKYKELKEQVE